MGPLGVASNQRWWLREVGYEIYLRSFADSDGDGVGDLRGVIDHLDDLAWLGIGVVWITPCMVSPMADHGYDVADYRVIAPEYGDEAVYRELCHEARRRGIRVLTDVVPNHTSSEHPWFVAARSSREDPKRDYYLWADPAADGGPPNNWVSHFGGPAWTLDRSTGQYWCHLFLPEQPDLNWHDERVRAEFDDVLRHWIGQGACGFRLDVAHALTKNRDWPDLPATPPDAVRWSGRAFDELQHVHDLDQPDNLEVHQRWRRVADPLEAVLVGEVYLLEPERLRRYLEPDDGLHVVFWFPPLHMEWTAEEVRRVLREAASLPAGKLGWITGSHDRHRAVSRYGGGEAGRQRAMTMRMLLWGLSGMPWLYQGEELALPNADVAPEDMRDAYAIRNPDRLHLSRDLARTPMPWRTGPGMGFTTGEPWLPLGGRAAVDTWAVQRADETSWLWATKRLIAAWRSLPELPKDVEWISGDGPVVHYRRGPLRVVANLGPAAVEVAVEGDAVVAFDRDPSRHGDGLRRGGLLDLPAEWAVWLLDADPVPSGP